MHLLIVHCLSSVLFNAIISEVSPIRIHRARSCRKLFKIMPHTQTAVLTRTGNISRVLEA